MNAALAVQAALVAALRDAVGLVALTGVYDGPPVRPRYPYAAIGGGAATDWSHKTGRGREHRLAVTLWDDGLTPTRLHALAGAAEEAIEAMPRDLPGHRIASLVLLRQFVTRDAGGPWAALIEYRVRTLEA